MKCKIICDLLPLYIDDVCSDETKELVERHLEKCPACRSEYEKMKAELSLHEAEDLDEKELMKKGEEKMKEYVKEKIYQKVILADTILNLLVTALGFTHGISGVMGGDPYYYAEMFIILGPLGIFFISDIIYWFRYVTRRRAGTVIVDTICKMSFWMKVVLLVCAIAMAATVGFYTLFTEWSW